MAVTFRAASGGQSSTAALAASVTKPTGTLTGDMVLVGLTVKDAQTFTAKSGWTLEQNANSNSNVSTTATYYRVLDGTESWPISFAWTGSSVKYAWTAAAFAPGTGNYMAVDGEAAVKVDTTATTHTANAQTAVAANVCSVIFNLHRNSSSGATGATVTAPTNWTEPTNGDQTTASGTTTALSQVGAEVCYRTGQSGTVTPGSCTLSLTGTQNTYHFLLTDPVTPVSAHAVLATGTGAAKRPQEYSPPLELSVFGSFSGVSPGDTINAVILTCNQFATSALMGPPVYELWDDSGTPALLGSGTGTASTSSANVDSVTFTGVTYAMLATLRVRIYARQGTAVSGAIQNVNWADLTANITPAANTALVAHGTGTAKNAVAAIGVTAVLASGTGTAQSTAFPPAVLATGAGAALNATAQTSAGTTAPAVLAAGTGTAQAPAAAIAVIAAPAPGTGTAQAPAAATGAAALLASGTGTAQGATAQTSSSGTATATVAAGTGTALNAAAVAAASVTAALAAGTGTAQAAPPAIGVTAVLAAGAGAALNPAVTTAASVTAVLAAGAGTALNAAASTSSSGSPAAGLASGTGTAQGAAAGIGVTAAAAAGTGTAQGASHAAPAGLAAGTGTAQAAALAIAANAAAAAALGAALNATAQGAAAFTVGILTASAAPPGVLTAAAAPGGSGGVLTASDTRTGGPG